MTIAPEVLAAAFVALLSSVGVGLRIVYKDVTTQRDRAMAISEGQIAATRLVAEGQAALTAAFNDYIREQSTRHRAGDGA